tara:strand:+ start:37 stop:528 length:492 start_codon:yes stop_codon:yes gene_type:complete
MKKITLILITLITVGCSDPNDEYIALECSVPLEIEGEYISFDLIMDDNSRTFSFYVDYGERIDETFGVDVSINKFALGGVQSVVNGTYINDGGYHYLLTITESLVFDDKFFESGEIKFEDTNLQNRLDRRTLKYTDEVGTTFQCREIDVPDYFLKDEENKIKI